MVNSKLSDDEVVTIAGLFTSGEVNNGVKYINKILYSKSLGDDSCARPLAFRDKKDMQETCFAKGYLIKVIDFINESEKRMPCDSVVASTKEFIKSIVDEIDKHFKNRS